MTSELDVSDEVSDFNSTRAQWVRALAQFREETERFGAEREVDGIIDLELSVGLVLFDITEKLQLDYEEQFLVLGPRLYDEILVQVFGHSRGRVH